MQVCRKILHILPLPRSSSPVCDHRLFGPLLQSEPECPINYGRKSLPTAWAYGAVSGLHLARKANEPVPLKRVDSPANEGCHQVDPIRQRSSFPRSVDWSCIWRYWGEGWRSYQATCWKRAGRTKRDSQRIQHPWDPLDQECCHRQRSTGSAPY